MLAVGVVPANILDHGKNVGRVALNHSLIVGMFHQRKHRAETGGGVMVQLVETGICEQADLHVERLQEFKGRRQLQRAPQRHGRHGRPRSLRSLYRKRLQRAEMRQLGYTGKVPSADRLAGLGRALHVRALGLDVGLGGAQVRVVGAKAHRQP